MNARWLGAGAFGASFVGSICCIGPVLLSLAGLGGAALLVRFEPYRPFFLAASAALLGAAFYLTYRRTPAASCAPGSDCVLPGARRGQKILLWLVTAAVVFAAAFPYLVEFLF